MAPLQPPAPPQYNYYLSNQDDSLQNTLAEVWNITEIAENILYHLPVKDLLLAQRVSKDWKALISTSPRLQERLFMRPEKPQATGERGFDGLPVRELNPLLAEKMHVWFDVPSEGDWQSVRKLPWFDTASRLAFLRKDASWRRMLLAQPPFTEFQYVRMTHAQGGDSLRAGSIEKEDGIRMGFVYDQTTARSQHFDRFYILMDGRCVQNLNYSINPKPEPVLEYELGEERYFGGVGGITFFTAISIGCVSNSRLSDREKKYLNEWRQCLSTGREEVEIKVERIEPPVQRGRPRSWWTREGYKRDRFKERMQKRERMLADGRLQL